MSVDLTNFWKELNNIFNKKTGKSKIPALIDEGLHVLIEQDLDTFVKSIGGDKVIIKSNTERLSVTFSPMEIKSKVTDFIDSTLLPKYLEMIEREYSTMTSSFATKRKTRKAYL